MVELPFEALIGQKLKSGALIGQKQVKHEREPKEQGIPILDILFMKLGNPTAARLANEGVGSKVVHQ